MNVERQARRNSIRIDFVGGEPFWLEENLVAGLAGEAMNLVFYGWAIAWTDALDDPGIHGRTIQPRSDYRVGFFIGMRNPAGQLPRMHAHVAHE